LNCKSLQTHANQALAAIYPPHEAKAIVRMLLMEMLHLSRAELLLSSHLELSETQTAQALQKVEQLQQMRPIQYVLGSAEFCGQQLAVNEHTLIPRPETEELVCWIVDEHRHASGSSISILDLGTGSGCIAIALAKQLPQAKVYACDISPQAISIAQQNAQRNGVEVRFATCDLRFETCDLRHETCDLRHETCDLRHETCDLRFETCDLRFETCDLRHETCDLRLTTYDLNFSIIVSNPPYVCESEKASMRDNVLRYEPHSALFVDDSDPLIFYTCIARLAQKYLHRDGEIFVEINERFGQQTADIFVAHGFACVELRRDIFGKERMMRARRI
jgi:release factor glutamine methyltransferase